MNKLIKPINKVAVRPEPHPAVCALVQKACLMAISLMLTSATLTQSIAAQNVDYENNIFTSTPTFAPGTDLGQTASIAFFSGNFGDITNIPTPTDGHVYLTQSAVGQPIGGQPLTFYLPGVSIVSPVSGSVFASPSTITLDAQAYQLAFDEYVQKVDFYVSGGACFSNTWIGSASNYGSLQGTNDFINYWYIDTPGNYTITAVATDDLGGTNTASVAVTVQAVILVNGQYTNTGNFTFVQGNPVNVTFDSLPGGSVRYTLDGTDPLTNGIVYENTPIAVTQSVYVQAAIADAETYPIADVDPVNITIIPVYPVTATTAGGGSVSVSPGPYASNSMVTFAAVQSNGWNFLGWTGTVVTNADSFSMPVDEAISEVAVFGTPLTLTQEAFGIVQVSPVLGNYPYGSSVMLTAIPSNNYYFQGWSGSASALGNASPAFLPVTMTNPVVMGFFSATHGSNSLTLEVGSGTGSVTAAPYATVYSNNAHISIIASNATGQSFLNWSGAASGSINPLPWTMTSNTTIIANFTSNSPPAVEITNPITGASFSSGTTIPLGVSVTVSNGSITNVTYFADGSAIGSATNSPYSFLWNNGAVGTHVLSATATASTGLSASSDNTVSVTITPATNPAVFAFATNNYTVNENGGYVTVYVTNYGNYGGSISYQTMDGTAYSGYGFGGDYTYTQGSLGFTNGQASNSFTVPIIDNGINQPGDPIYFQVQLLDPSQGTTNGAPSVATVTITRNEPGNPSEAWLPQALPSAPTADAGQLIVLLTPPSANGQWHFPWEYLWHTNGETVSNLPPGQYPVLCRNIPNYEVNQLTNDVTVSNGLNIASNQYYPLEPTNPVSYGSITVTTTPSFLGAGWRFFGETAWRSNGSTSASLLADIYNVQFQPIQGYMTPTSLAVTVSGGNVSVPENYLAASNASGTTPQLVPSNPPEYYTQAPYEFCGQLQTDVGYGSGTIVRSNVVLTAAHMVFNDATLSFVTNAWWSFQEETGFNNPEPLAPRGWYILDGYAAQRTNDILTTGNYVAGEPSPASSDLDLAALYFLEAAGNGGSCGYICSDAAPNQYLTNLTVQKTLVGYPVDGSMFGQVLTPGLMYSEAFDTAVFNEDTDEVYTVSTAFNYPGASGAALFVEYNDKPYPAAIYLGTLYTNHIPRASIFRALDHKAFDLMDYAANVSGGTNNSGGGPIAFNNGSGSGNTPIYAVQIEPLAALADGGAWEFVGENGVDFSPTDQTYYQSVTAGLSYQVEFAPLKGWNSPMNVTPPNPQGPQPQEVTATYTLIASWPLPQGSTPYGTPLPAATTQLNVPGTWTYSDQSGNQWGAGQFLPVNTYNLTATFTPSPSFPNPANYYGNPFTLNGPFVVTQAPLTFTVGNLNVPYGEYSLGNPAFSPLTVNGVAISYTTTPIPPTSVPLSSTSPPGSTYSIVPSVANGNYVLQNVSPGALTITQTSLTVPAGDYYRGYNQANPTFSLIPVSGQNTDKLTAKITCSATVSTPPGAYPLSLVSLIGTAASYYSPVTVSGYLGIIPPILSYQLSGQSLTFTWNGGAGQQFQVQSSSSLDPQTWVTLAIETAPPGGTMSLMTATETVSGTTEFFRVLPVMPQ